MAWCATRYCLGRRSYVVSSCIAWLSRWWDCIERDARNIIVRDIVEFLMDTEAYGWIDAGNMWRVFAEQMFQELPEEDKLWIRRAVEYRDKPWPLHQAGEENDE